MVRLSFHPIGLGVNILAGLFQEQRLPDHCSYLQKPDEYQQAGENRQFPLYLEILAGLLASFIASWGGWLMGGRHRIRGVLLAVLGLALIASVLTTIGFCDPLFWRPYLRILTGQNPYRCQWDEQGQYRQVFQHDGENVAQKQIDFPLTSMKGSKLWIEGGGEQSNGAAGLLRDLGPCGSSQLRFSTTSRGSQWHEI
jgi:hypothetical protein